VELELLSVTRLSRGSSAGMHSAESCQELMFARRDQRRIKLVFFFPPFRGGLFFWADTMGPQKIIEKLKPYAKLGKRFEPTKLLKLLAQEHAKFYDYSGKK
jgi:hypothetical protein